MFCLGQTSKTADTLIIPNVAANNQPETNQEVGASNRKSLLNDVGIGLVTGQVWAKVLPLIIPMEAHLIDIGVYYALQDQLFC